MASTGAFHHGERTMQATMGAADRLAQVGAVAIRDHLPRQHREFFSLLPFLVIGSIDHSGQPSASILASPPGFVQAPDEWHLRVAALPRSYDPLNLNLKRGAPLGILGIEPHTRRRNRVNGRVNRLDEHGFSLAVEQSFGNCAKYIHARESSYVQHASRAEPICDDGLPDNAHALIALADTCFIASAHPDALVADDRSHGVDVSHRGGPPGFIGFMSDNTLMLPDFPGNRFFNTFGNLVLNPLAGIMILDNVTGDVWQFDVSCQIVTDPDQITPDLHAERALLCKVMRTRRALAAMPLHWGEVTQSRPL